MEWQVNKLGSFFGMFIISVVSFSQTTNVGMLYISPGEQFSTLTALNNSATGNIVNDGELFVYDHFTNGGTVGFTPNINSGITRLYGQTGFQELAGSGVTNLYNVEFNNDKTQYSFHLMNNITIYGKADFQNGIIDNVNYPGNLIFENSASVENADHVSHVSGTVIKKGNKDFTFPVGDGGKYRLASISAPNAVTDRYSARYHFKNPNGDYPLASKVYGIQEINNKEYWEINKLAGDSPVILTLSWDASTSADFITANPEGIYIVRWDPAKELWEYLDSTVDLAKKEVTTVVPTLNYGIFTLATVDKEVVEEYKFVNGLSPNDDGINDFLQLDFLEGNPKNTVILFNRWGTKVYETSAYNTTGNVFRGFAEGVSVIGKKELLPAGTYFYVIEFTNEQTGAHSNLSGYIYIIY